MEAATEADRELYEYVRTQFFPAQVEKARQLAKDKKTDVTVDRYLQSRMFTNLAYRPAVKIKRKLGL